MFFSHCPERGEIFVRKQLHLISSYLEHWNIGTNMIACKNNTMMAGQAAQTRHIATVLRLYVNKLPGQSRARQSHGSRRWGRRGVCGHRALCRGGIGLVAAATPHAWAAGAPKNLDRWSTSCRSMRNCVSIRYRNGYVDKPQLKFSSLSEPSAVG
jgi:hypothetical protein